MNELNESTARRWLRYAHARKAV